ncbi:hypothetical protein KCU95_g124, partial [Aureobasidium melanogenum]
LTALSEGTDLAVTYGVGCCDVLCAPVNMRRMCKGASRIAAAYTGGSRQRVHTFLMRDSVKSAGRFLGCLTDMPNSRASSSEWTVSSSSSSSHDGSVSVQLPGG